MTSQSEANLKNMIPNGNASTSKKSKKTFAFLGLHKSSPIKAPHQRAQTNFNFGNVMPITQEYKDKDNEKIEHRKLDLNSSSVAMLSEAKQVNCQPVLLFEVVCVLLFCDNGDFSFNTEH